MLSTKKYAKESGPYQTLSRQVYEDLRGKLIQSVLKDYDRSSFLWEQYSPETGKGQRNRLFTGWTSMILLIMAEVYD